MHFVRVCTLVSNQLILFWLSQIRYTGYRDRPLEERQIRFINGCREGHADVVSVILSLVKCSLVTCYPWLMN